MTSRSSAIAQSEVLSQPKIMKLVLVVDDSRLQRRILSKSLSKLGFEVVEAESGEQAIELCQQRRPDLIVSDWMMPPGMSGLAFCRAFRALPGDHYAYFILLTSKSEKAEVARGLDSGADDFLTKPVDSNELRARITAGERILQMQRELTATNHLISDTLDELQHLYDSLDKDLLEAKKLQQSLLRERHKVFDQGTLSLMLRSSGHVGGDLVGFYPAGKDQLGLFAIDVSGHGVSSALMTARLAGYLSATALDQNVALKRQEDGTHISRPLHEVVAALNDLVLNEMETEHYFTLMLATIDLTTGKTTIAQAGHPHPAIQRRDGSVVQAGLGGFPVGLVAGISFEQFEVQLQPGDRLLILSDGVTECPNSSDEMLGEDGLESIMTKLKDVKGTAFFEALIWEMTEFALGDEFPDDVSGILFEYQGSDQPA